MVDVTIASCSKLYRLGQEPIRLGLHVGLGLDVLVFNQFSAKALPRYESRLSFGREIKAWPKAWTGNCILIYT